MDDTEIPSYECENYSSILEGGFHAEMSEILCNDITEGRVKQVDVKPHCIHSLGGVQKSNGHLRPITDCSMPVDISVNNFMSGTCKKFTYKSVDTLAQLVSPDDFMCVTDISSTFRSVSIHPDHCTYQGFSWVTDGEVKYYEEKRLCFGLKCAPYKFDLLSQLVVDMARENGIERIVNYLDDFAIVEESLHKCAQAQSVLIRILRKMGFAVAWSKIEPPLHKVKFLGIMVDSETMTLSLPMSKIDKLTNAIAQLESRGSATKRELESVAGLMAHCATVIKGGRTFSRRVYDLCDSVSRRGRTLLSEEMLLDFEWWKNFCKIVNGSASIVKRESSAAMNSDASLAGFGAWCEDDWFFGSWSSHSNSVLSVHNHVEPPPVCPMVNTNINTMKLWPVLLGLRRWGPSNRGTTIEVVTDNSQVMFMVNTGRSHNKRCMGWLREIFSSCFVYNIDIYASYVRSENNMLDDALSRLGDQSKVDESVSLICLNHMCCFDLLGRSIAGRPPWEGGSARVELSSTCNKLGKRKPKETLLRLL